MKLIDLLQIIKTCITELDSENGFKIGKLDTSVEKTLCLYDVAREAPPVMAIGGISNSSYDMLPCKIVLRYGKNKNQAQQKANELFANMLGKKFAIENKGSWFEMRCQAPISLDTDEKDVCEYAINFNTYYER